MTGFGRGEAQSENWIVSVVMRSVNGKGLDVSVRAPTFLLPLEKEIKDLVREKLIRGTVHVFIEAEPKNITSPVDTEKLFSSIKMLKDLTEGAGISVSDDVLFEISWRFSERLSSEVDEELKETLLAAVKQALEDLILSREKEGRALKEDITRRLEAIEGALKALLERKDSIYEEVKNKVLERAKNLGLPEEHPTVVQEILFLLERMDVEEEVTRLKTHVEAFKNFLEREGEVGKRLEFLAQEMHREITTLGNKLPGVSDLVVEIKANVDRIKQQAANVE